MGPDRCTVIKQYLYGPKFLQVIFCYCFYTWAAQPISWIFHLDISFLCWFRGIRVPFCVFWTLFTFCQVCWRTRRMWVRSLSMWRSWLNRRQDVRGCRKNWCTDTLGGLFEHVPEICLLHCQISGFGTIFVNCWRMKISGISAFRLKDFYCI
jgi:hypothetical protein